MERRRRFTCTAGMWRRGGRGAAKRCCGCRRSPTGRRGNRFGGGVPICFPWFGAHATQPAFPAHGFARLKPWRLEEITRSPLGLYISLVLTSDDTTRKFWPHEFVLHNRLKLDERGLTMHLELTNTGKERFSAEMAQ